MSEPLREGVESVLADLDRRGAQTGGSYEDAVRRSVCRRYADELRTLLLADTGLTPDEREVIAQRILNTVDPLLPGHEARTACVRIVRGAGA